VGGVQFLTKDLQGKPESLRPEVCLDGAVVWIEDGKVTQRAVPQLKVSGMSDESPPSTRVE
jgi:hypothetical protein